MLEVNYLAVITAAMAAFAFGALWYSPVAFQKVWMRESGVNPDVHMKSPARVFGSTFLMTLVSAWVLALALGPSPEIVASLLVGLLAGAGLVAASIGINYQFANRSLSLWLIDGGFHTVRFAIMGLVIALWG